MPRIPNTIGFLVAVGGRPANWSGRLCVAGAYHPVTVFPDRNTAQRAINRNLADTTRLRLAWQRSDYAIKRVASYQSSDA